jgi:hypothetical protein
MNNFCPDYFVNYLSSTVPNVKSTRAKIYQLLPVNTLNVYEKNSFKNFASQSWCEQPIDLKCNISFSVFKKRIYHNLLSELLDTLICQADSFDTCNLSCIDSVLNYHSDDDDS